MKRFIQFTMMAVAMITAFTLTSCSSDDEPAKTYSYEFFAGVNTTMVTLAGDLETMHIDTPVKKYLEEKAQALQSKLGPVVKANTTDKTEELKSLLEEKEKELRKEIEEYLATHDLGSSSYEGTVILSLTLNNETVETYKIKVKYDLRRYNNENNISIVASPATVLETEQEYPLGKVIDLDELGLLASESANFTINKAGIKVFNRETNELCAEGASIIDLVKVENGKLHIVLKFIKKDKDNYKGKYTILIPTNQGNIPLPYIAVYADLDQQEDK